MIGNIFDKAEAVYESESETLLDTLAYTTAVNQYQENF